jgi:hypothetical protein
VLLIPDVGGSNVDVPYGLQVDDLIGFLIAFTDIRMIMIIIIITIIIIIIIIIIISTASVVLWSEFLATDADLRVRFPALPDFPRSSDLEWGPLSIVSPIEELLGRKSSGSCL